MSDSFIRDSLRQLPKRKGLIVCSQRAQNLIYKTKEFLDLEPSIDWVHRPVTNKELIDLTPHPLNEVEVLFTGWSGPMLNESNLRLMPHLQAVFHAGGTVRGIVSPDFWKLGIPIFNTKEANAIPVAEYTYAQIILGLKRAGYLQRFIHERHAFPQEIYRDYLDNPPPFHGAYQQPVGLIGLSLIGRKTARLLQCSDLRLHCYDPHVEAEEMRRLGIQKCSLEELFETCLVVSLHAPELPETCQMVRGEHLASMPAGGVFINTSRGSLIHQEEMYQVLKNRPDLWAVLDVTEPEPLPRDDPLLGLPNLSITPHIAGALGSETRRLARDLCSEYAQWVQNLPTRFQVCESDMAIQA